MKKRELTYLFLCRVGLNRSPTAAAVCQRMAIEAGRNVHAVSAGIDPDSVNPLTHKLANDADLIFVMESYMQDELFHNFHQPIEKIIVLDIPDIYPANDPRLVMTLEMLLKDYAGSYHHV